jgi:hypothetical protein
MPELDSASSRNQDSEVRSALSDAIKSCPKKRAQIAEEMALALGLRVTEPMLNAFTSDSHEGHRFPLAWTASFCHVTGDTRLLSLIAKPLGLAIFNESDLALRELGIEIMRRREAERQVADLVRRLKEKG